MSNIVPKDQAELEAMANEYFSEATLRFPKFSIGQGSPKAPKKVAHFNSDAGESFLRLEGVAYSHKFSSNVLFRGNDSQDKSAACGSDDGIKPALRFLKPVCDSCLVCPALKWSSDQSESDIHSDSFFKKELAKQIGHTQFDSKKPLCTQMQNLVLIDSGGSPFGLQVSKHNLSQVQKLEMVLQSLCLKHRVPGFAFVFDLWLTPVTGQGNRQLLNFSQSKDWKISSIDEIRSKKSVVGYIKKNGAQLFADRHAEQDQAHSREVSEVSSFDSHPDDSEVPF